ncbi:NADAR domain-containing protein, partial [Clostridium perfringens]
WGIGMGAKDENIEDSTAWKGENLLGFALMEVRDLLNTM